MSDRKGKRRSPQQQRSRDLVNAVREAGRLLLEEGGPKALTTHRIAERAGALEDNVGLPRLPGRAIERVAQVQLFRRLIDFFEPADSLKSSRDRVKRALPHGLHRNWRSTTYDCASYCDGSCFSPVYHGWMTRADPRTEGWMLKDAWTIRQYP